MESGLGDCAIRARRGGNLKVLITCPPLARKIDFFKPLMEKKGWEIFCPPIVQVLPESELLELLPQFDGWIMGDDPANRKVLSAGRQGRLKAAIKWGIGVDNVDFEACKDLKISITNTPGQFGNEVADVALGMILMLGRSLHEIDQAVRRGEWLKIRGHSFVGKKAGVVGFGDIGKQLAKRLQAIGMEVHAYDPAFKPASDLDIKNLNWPQGIETLDYLALTCNLNSSNYHLINETILKTCRQGMIVINVARGPLIDEPSLVKALQSGHVAGAGLDVFEIEPLPASSPLREMKNVVLGSHNGSNTDEAVIRASLQAIDKLDSFLKESS